MTRSSAILAGILLVLFTIKVAAAPLNPDDYPSLGSLEVTSGALTIDTDALTISGAASFTGLSSAQVGGPEVAIFTFDEITIAAAATITFTGARPVALLSQGNAAIAAAIRVDGGQGQVPLSPTTAGAAGPAGGASGGLGRSSGSSSGSGPGASSGGGGAGYGGRGGGSGAGGDFAGQAYGNLSNVLQGGSGGGGWSIQAPGGGGGGGAGAIEVGAVGNLTLGTLSARGGEGGWYAYSQTVGQGGLNGGGGGSGGAFLLQGATITLTDSIDIRGGRGGTGATFAGGGGGAGRARLITGSSFVLGAQNPAINTAGGAGGSKDGSGLAGKPGQAGVAELAPALTIMPSGYARQVDSVGEFSESVSGGWTLKTRDLQVDPGALVFSTAAVESSHNLVFNGGSVNASMGWTLMEAASLSGFGILSGPVAGGELTHINASGGTLTLGDGNHATGFSFAGTIEIAAEASLHLLDRDVASLGANTMLADGAALSSLRGASLDFSKVITANGSAELHGHFTNNGVVKGPTGDGKFLIFTDDVDGEGNYTGNVLFSDGFSPGASPAHVSLEHVTFDATAELSIELGGTTPGSQFDQLTVSGDATLGGKLSVSLINDFTPAAGNSFHILNCANQTGEFATIELPTLPATLAWDASQLYAAGMLSVIDAISYAGDFDEDGEVDAADLAQWRGDFGLNALSDADNDGDSDGTDFLQWQRQLGSVPAVAATAVVPEPGTFLLFIVALAGFVDRAPKASRTHLRVRRADNPPELDTVPLEK